MINKQRLSQEYLELLDRATFLMLAVKNKSWSELVTNARLSLETGHQNIGKYLNWYQDIQKVSDLKEKITLLNLLTKCTKANEILLRDALTLLVEYHLGQTSNTGQAALTLRNFSISELIKTVKREIMITNLELEAVQLSIFASVVSKDSQSELIDKHLLAVATAQKIALETSSKIGAYKKVLRQELHKKVTGVSLQLADQMAKMNSLLREAITTFIACHLLMYARLNFPGYDKLPKNKINYIPFAVNLPNGKDVKIASLGVAQEGDYLQIQGLVKDIKRVEKGKHMGYIVTIADAQQHVSLPIVFLFSNPTSYGIIEGSFSNLSGHIVTNNKLLKGEKVIAVDKLRMQTELSLSWKYWFLDTASAYYKLYPQNLNITFFPLN